MDQFNTNNNNGDKGYKKFRAAPTMPMDIHTFANLRKSEGEDSRGSKTTIFSWVPAGDHQELNQVSTVWLVAYVKSCRIRQQKPGQNQDADTILPFNLDLEVRDGTGQLKIVQFRTTLGINGGDTGVKIPPFIEEQYYSFIIKPFLPKPPVDSTSKPLDLSHHATLVSFHKITNFNEITAHLSQFVRARQFLISPMKLTVAKLIRGYSFNKQGLRREILKEHLTEYLDPLKNQNSDNYSAELDQYLQFLIQSGMVTESEYGLLLVPDEPQQE